LKRVFPEVFNTSQVFQDATHGKEHHLVTFGPSIASKFWGLDSGKLVAAKREFDKMEKTNGSWRPFGNVRR
jgi:hypothetical protein